MRLIASGTIVGILFVLGEIFGSVSKTTHPTILAADNTATSTAVVSSSPAITTFLVTRVIDGDTVELEGGTRVRYVGIDTPESVDPRKPVQCFAKEASRRNSELTLGKRVRLEKDVSETDKYGRLLRFVYVGDTFVNLELVREGYAHSFPYPPDISRAELFRKAEQEARKAKRGFWNSCGEETQGAAVTPGILDPTDGSAPANGCVIKGNISSGGKIYHQPGCPYYAKTVISESSGERWFCSEEDALAAGWRKARNCQR